MKLLILSFLLCTLLALSQAADEKKKTSGPEQNVSEVIKKTSGIKQVVSEVKQDEALMKEIVSEEKQDEAVMEEIVSEEKQDEAVMEEVVSEGEKHDVRRGVCCPSGWGRYGNRCFLYIGAAYTWAQAENYCVVYQGGNLASVHSWSEYLWLRSYVYSRTGGYPYFWIGGSDAQQERFWFWSNGSRMNYGRWCSGTPRTHTALNCMVNAPGSSCWFDLPCTYSYVFVCARRLR